MMKYCIYSMIVIGIAGIVVGGLLMVEQPVDYDCDDFGGSHARAVAEFKKHDTDIYHLDRDKDLVPCEELIRT